MNRDFELSAGEHLANFTSNSLHHNSYYILFIFTFERQYLQWLLFIPHHQIFGPHLSDFSVAYGLLTTTKKNGAMSASCRRLRLWKLVRHLGLPPPPFFFIKRTERAPFRTNKSRKKTNKAGQNNMAQVDVTLFFIFFYWIKKKRREYTSNRIFLKLVPMCIDRGLSRRVLCANQYLLSAICCLDVSDGRDPAYRVTIFTGIKFI